MGTKSRCTERLLENYWCGSSISLGSSMREMTKRRGEEETTTTTRTRRKRKSQPATTSVPQAS